MTVKELKQFLVGAPDDGMVTNQLNEPFIHVVSDGDFILSTQRPIAYCKRTGEYVYPTTTEGYYGFSRDLHEDVYEFETIPLEKDKWENFGKE